MSQIAGFPHVNVLRVAAWSAAAALLLAPLIAMRFTSEVNWGAEDFLAAALLLGGGGLSLEAMVRLVRGTRARIITGIVIVLALVLIWAQLAVGIL